MSKEVNYKDKELYLDWNADNDLKNVTWNFPKVQGEYYDIILSRSEKPLREKIVDYMVKKHGEPIMAIALLEEERGRYL